MIIESEELFHPNQSSLDSFASIQILNGGSIHQNRLVKKHNICQFTNIFCKFGNTRIVDFTTPLFPY